MKWSSTMTKDFCAQIRKGLTDREMVPVMNALYPGGWNVHVVRSKRGRLERARVLTKGLSGSSKEKNLMSKKVKRQLWSPAAEKRLRELHRAGRSNRGIATTLKREGLRREFNPGAIGDRLSYLRNLPEPSKITTPPSMKRGTNRVELMAKNGTNLVFMVPDLAFVEISTICCKTALGLPIRSIDSAEG